MSFDCDAVVAGAGIVGIAVARALARAGESVVLLEPEAGPVVHTSSRNSEVIHAGLYYPAGSWKARLCVPGRHALYAYLAERGLPHRRTGKLVVASEEAERPALERVRAAATRNGVEGLRWLEREAVRERAPELRAVAALHVPVTGIVDSHALAMSLLADAEASGCTIAWRQQVSGLAVDAAGVTATVVDALDGEAAPLRARRVVNCAGHGAPALYHATDGAGPRRAYAPAWAKGNYAAVGGRGPADELIYPVPQAHGLGVHVTLDLAGRVRLGPDVEWTDRFDDYAVDPAFAERARSAAARYWPALAERTVRPDYAGVRPKLRLDGELVGDFVFEREPDRPDWRVLHCMGIESPGLTCALAIGALVAGSSADAGPAPASALTGEATVTRN